MEVVLACQIGGDGTAQGTALRADLDLGASVNASAVICLKFLGDATLSPSKGGMG